MAVVYKTYVDNSVSSLRPVELFHLGTYQR
jgi:hypothetical protein